MINWPRPKRPSAVASTRRAPLCRYRTAGRRSPDSFVNIPLLKDYGSSVGRNTNLGYPFRCDNVVYLLHAADDPRARYKRCALGYGIEGVAKLNEATEGITNRICS
jgi:hypothetical protein